MVIAQSCATLLIIAHAAAAIVLIGASTHNAIVALQLLRGRYNARLGRIYGTVVAISYGVTFALGAITYPAFRVLVRGGYLDEHAPRAVVVFDMKENFAALGLAIACAVFVMSRVVTSKNDRCFVIATIAFAVAIAAIVWFNLFSGLWITMVRSV